LWGWGTPELASNGTVGYSKDQTSIDNEYIRVAMWQGYVGIFLFVSMELLSIWQLIKLCISLRNREDILFCYCLLGAIVASAFSLTTVYLGDPMMQILFLMFGWAMSIRPTRSVEEIQVPLATGKYAFQRVFA
jgi:hypothetical protein